jgi:hypothetical protein
VLCREMAARKAGFAEVVSEFYGRCAACEGKAG